MGKQKPNENSLHNTGELTTNYKGDCWLPAPVLHNSTTILSIHFLTECST